MKIRPKIFVGKAKQTESSRSTKTWARKFV